MGGSYPVLRPLQPATGWFFSFFKCILKCMEFSPKPSSCCLATAVGPEVSSYRRVDSCLVPALELSKPAGGGQGLVQSSGPRGQWH